MPGLAAPDPILIAIVVLISSHDVPIVKLLRKSLLGSSPHDVVTHRADTQIAGITRWWLHQNWGRGWKSFIFLHWSRTVASRFVISVGVWHDWRECGTNCSYKSREIGISRRIVLKWPNLITIRYYKCPSRFPTINVCFVHVYGTSVQIRSGGVWSRPGPLNTTNIWTQIYLFFCKQKWK